MTSIKLMVTGAQAWASVTGPLTSGMVGIPVTIEYDEVWAGLTKNLMCRCSPWGSNNGEYRAILDVGETATVAHEVMQSDMYLYLGVEGFSDDGNLVIPTTWARCGRIEYGANSCDDPSTDPELSVWNQLQIEMEQTKEYVLTPEQADNIQSYAQEAAQSAQEAKQAAEEAKQTAESGLYYIPSVSQPTDATLKFEFKPSLSGFPIPKPVTVELPVGESSGENVVVIEPAVGDIPKVFFSGPVQQTKDEVIVQFWYYSKTLKFTGWAKIKAQGNSSMGYDKKNQTVKLYQDAECTEKLKISFRGWGEQYKFCFKANYIDHTHARNVVLARIWSKVVAGRANYGALPEELRTSPNNGGVDGFPIKLYAEGVYQGLYTFNIPKDGWTYNMDDELETHAVIQADSNAEACAWRSATFSPSTDWTDELHDSMPSGVQTRWGEILDFVLNSTDEEFIANLDSYIDVDSVIDTRIFIDFFCLIDSLRKNQQYLSYNALTGKYFSNMYDMDSGVGLWWDGQSIISPYTKFQSGFATGVAGYASNLLYDRMDQCFSARIQARYAELRETVLSVPNVVNEFERFTDNIPPHLYDEDLTVFPSIPSADDSNIQQIRDFIAKRAPFVDESIANLGKTAYSVTNNLTGCVNSNPAVAVFEGESYAATVAAIDGYTLESIECTMGGVAQTVTDGSISIESVTGDIAITAVATAEADTIVIASSVEDMIPRANTDKVTIADGQMIYAATADYTGCAITSNLVRWGDVKGKTLCVSVTGYAGDDSFSHANFTYGLYSGITSASEITGNAEPRNEKSIASQLGTEQKTATYEAVLSGSFSQGATTAYDDDTLFGCALFFKNASSTFTVTGISIVVK